MNHPIDFLGSEIRAGDMLVYPVRRGSKMWLNKLTVTKAEIDVIHGISPTGRMVKLTNLKNTIIVA